MDSHRSFFKCFCKFFNRNGSDSKRDDVTRKTDAERSPLQVCMRSNKIHLLGNIIFCCKSMSDVLHRVNEIVRSFAKITLFNA